MKIRTIVKSLYSANKVQTLAKKTLDEIETLKPKQVVVTALSESLSAAYEALKKARGNSRHNTQTQQVADADEVRDLAFRAFYKYVEAGTLRQNEKFRTTAQVILVHLAKTDRELAYRMGYTEESTELTLLFAEMEKITDKLAAIGADAWLGELKNAESAFLAKQEGKLDEEVEKQVLKPAKEAKEQTLLQLEALTQTLNGLEMAGLKGISDLNARINQVIAEVEIPARARQTRRGNEEEESFEL